MDLNPVAGLLILQWPPVLLVEFGQLDADDVDSQGYVGHSVVGRIFDCGDVLLVEEDLNAMAGQRIGPALDGKGNSDRSFGNQQIGLSVVGRVSDCDRWRPFLDTGTNGAYQSILALAATSAAAVVATVESGAICRADISAEPLGAVRLVVGTLTARSVTAIVAAFQVRASRLTGGLSAGSFLTDGAFFTLSTTPVTVIVAALLVRAVGGAIYDAVEVRVADWFLLRTLAAVSIAAVGTTLLSGTVWFTYYFCTETFLAAEICLAFAAVTFVRGARCSALQVVAKEVAFDGAGPLLAQAKRTVPAATAAAVVAAVKPGAVRNTDHASTVVTDVADTAIAAASATAVGAADFAIACRSARTRAVGRAFFPLSAITAVAAAAVVPAGFAEAIGGAGAVACHYIGTAGDRITGAVAAAAA